MKPFLDRDVEIYQEIIEILGEDKIEKLYGLVGPSKFSIAALRNFLKKKKIIDCIQNGQSFRKIASTEGVSKMTVYRYFKNGIKK